MKKLMLAVVAGALVLGGITAWAYYGSSNLDAFGYPGPRCSEPFVPFDRSDEYAVNTFNMELDSYRTCIQRYLEAAKNDQQMIMEKHNDVVRKYNNFVITIR